MQKVMNCAAGFTLGRYATVIDVIKLNWLPVKEQIQLNIAKLVHKALYKEGLPNYLKLELTSNIRILWSNTETRITPFGHKNSFIYRGPTIFNVLPGNIKKINSEKKFVSAAKQHLFNQAYAYVLQTANKFCFHFLSFTFELKRV